MTQNNNQLAASATEIPIVICHVCKRTIFDGTVIRARAVNVINSTALCRCKEWITVPITLN